MPYGIKETDWAHMSWHARARAQRAHQQIINHCSPTEPAPTSTPFVHRRHTPRLTIRKAGDRHWVMTQTSGTGQITAEAARVETLWQLASTLQATSA